MPLVFILNTVSLIILIILMDTPQHRVKMKKIFLFICTIQFTIIIGTRTLTTGRDTLAYYQMFEYIRQAPLQTSLQIMRIESLYVILMFVIGKLTGSYVVFNLFVAFATMLFISMAFYRSSKDCYLSVYLFLSTCIFYQMLNQCRQILACAVCLFAVTYLGKKHGTRWFLFWTVIAFFIHYSAICVCVLLYHSTEKIKLKRVVFFALLAVGIWPTIHDIIDFLKPSWYSYAGVEFQRSVILNTGVRITLLSFALYLYHRLFYSYSPQLILERSKKSATNNINVFYRMALWCTLFQFFAVRFNIMGRLTTYFFFGYYILIPELTEKAYRNPVLKRRLTVFVYILFFAYYLVYYWFSTRATLNYSSYLFDNLTHMFMPI